MESLWDALRTLHESAGINLVHFYDSFERGRLLRGMWTTLQLAALCVGLSVVIGIVGAWLQGSRFGLLKSLVQGYIQFFRNTPPLVQMYFFYFALGPQMPRIVNEYGIAEPLLGSFEWAVVSLAFFAGAYNVEIFRSGVEAVSNSSTRYVLSARASASATSSSRFTKTRFLRTSTWTVRARPVESVALISLVSLRVSVILDLVLSSPCERRR